MKLISLVLAVAFCANTHAGAIAQTIQIERTKPEDIIYWSENQRLSWTDFKGRQWKMDAKYAATTAGIISTQYDVNGDFLIITSRSIFNKARSAFRSGYETTFILQHEQLHFDILELFCRKLKKAISDIGSFKPGVTVYEIEKLKKQIYNACEDTQHAYDEECYRFPENQKDWVNKIAVEIESLKEFRDPAVRLPITH